MSQLPEHLQNLVEEIKNEDLGSTKTRNPTSTKEKRIAFTCLSSGRLHPCFSTNAPYQAQQLLSHSVTLCFPALYSKEITFTITAASTLSVKPQNVQNTQEYSLQLFYCRTTEMQIKYIRSCLFPHFCYWHSISLPNSFKDKMWGLL